MNESKTFLHMGTHNTSTTSVQKVFRSNGKQLLESVKVKWIEVQDFPELTKYKVLSEVESLKNENVGYSNSAKRIAQDLNPMLGNDANRQVRLGLQSVANKGVLKEYNLLNQKNKQDLVDSFEPSNRAFFEKYISSEVGVSGFSQPSFIKQDELSEVENYQRLVVYLANNLTEQIKLRKLTKKSLRNRVSGKLKSVLKNGFKG